MMTMEKQRYAAVVIDRAKSALILEAMVSVGLVCTALLLLESMI
jgi:hypothetical protein